jgi:hypothetical protein
MPLYVYTNCRYYISRSLSQVVFFHRLYFCYSVTIILLYYYYILTSILFPYSYCNFFLTKSSLFLLYSYSRARGSHGTTFLSRIPYSYPRPLLFHYLFAHGYCGAGTAAICGPCGWRHESGEWYVCWTEQNMCVFDEFTQVSHPVFCVRGVLYYTMSQRYRCI